MKTLGKRMQMMTRWICVIFAFLFLLPSCVYAITEDEARLFSQQSHERALAEAKKQNIELASMYFINALAFNPGDVIVIADYVNTVLDWAKSDGADSAMDSLEALESFVSTQIMTVKPDDLPEIVDLREKIALGREGLLESHTSTDRAKEENIEKQIATLKKEAEQSSEIRQYVDILEKASLLSNETDLEDFEIGEKLQTGLMLLSGMEQIKTLLARSEAPALLPLQMYYLQLAENSLQQLVALSAALPSGVSHEIIQIKKGLDDRLNAISEERSQLLFTEINEKFIALEKQNNAKLGKNYSCEGNWPSTKRGPIQKMLDKINALIRDISVKAQGVSSPAYGKLLEEMMGKVQIHAIKLRAKQEETYVEWAILRMKNAVGKVKEHEGSTDAKDKMRKIMVEQLACIDTRLLNFGGQQCFNATYGELHSKLNKENQRLLDEALAFVKKIGLDRF